MGSLSQNANAFMQETKSVMNGVKYSLHHHKAGSLMRQLVLASPKFAELPEGRCRVIEMRNVLKGTE